MALRREMGYKFQRSIVESACLVVNEKYCDVTGKICELWYCYNHCNKGNFGKLPVILS